MAHLRKTGLVCLSEMNLRDINMVSTRSLVFVAEPLGRVRVRRIERAGRAKSRTLVLTFRVPLTDTQRARCVETYKTACGCWSLSS